MLLFCFVLAALSSNFYVSATSLLAIGNDTIVPADVKVCSPIYHTDPPSSNHPSYKVRNNGESPIEASIYWKSSWPLQADDQYCKAHMNCSAGSTTNVWYELGEAVVIEPSSVAIIKPSSSKFYFTRLVVVAKNNGSIVHVEYSQGTRGLRRLGFGDSSDANVSASANLKAVLKFSGSKLPPTVTGSGIEALIQLFWPQNQTGPFEEVVDEVRHVVDPYTLGYIDNLLTGKLLKIKSQLVQVARAIREEQSDASSQYMDLAEDLIGLEEEFVIRNNFNAEKLNSDLLPVYSTAVSLKSLFYNLGRKCGHKMNLNEQNTADMKRRHRKLLREAEEHTWKYLKDKHNHTSNREFDKLMFQRNTLKQDGFVPLWTNLLDHPGQKFIDDGLIFSPLLGEETDQILDYARHPRVPLSPSLLPDETYNTLERLEFYSGPCVNEEHLCIVTMKQTLKNGSHISIGKPVRHPLTDIVMTQDTKYPITSVKLQEEFPNHSTLFVGRRSSSLNCTFYQNIGLVSSEYFRTDEKNVTLEAPDGYKLSSMYWDFDGYRLRNVVLSFLPYRNPNEDEDWASWKFWNC